MNQLLLSLLIGLIAAIIDVTPMILQKLDRSFVISAFLFWIVAGVMIPRMTLVENGWINGSLCAFLLLVPQLFLIGKLDPKAIPIIVGTTLVLGAGVGFASSKLIHFSG